MSTTRRNPMSALKSRVQKQKTSFTKGVDKSRTQGMLSSEKRLNEKLNNMDHNDDKVSTSCGSFTAAKKIPQIMKRKSSKKSKSTLETKQATPPLPAAPLDTPTSPQDTPTSPQDTPAIALPPLKEKRFSSSVDSGRGDELSSSCGSSSVFTNGHKAISEKLNETDDNGCSPTEEDVFMDARSNLSSDDDEDYKTPLTSRSPSLSCLLSPSLSVTVPSSSSAASSVTTLDGCTDTPTDITLLGFTNNDLMTSEDGSSDEIMSRFLVSGTDDLPLKPSNKEACQGVENDSGVEELQSNGDCSLDSSVSGCPESSIDSTHVSFIVGGSDTTDQSSNPPTTFKEHKVPPLHSLLRSSSSRSSSFESMNLASPISPTGYASLSLPSPRASHAHSPSPPTPTRTRSSKNIVIDVSPKRSKSKSPYKSSKDHLKSKPLLKNETATHSDSQTPPVGVVCNDGTALGHEEFSNTAQTVTCNNLLPNDVERCDHDVTDATDSSDHGIDDTDRDDCDIDHINHDIDSRNDISPSPRHPLQCAWILWYDKITSSRPSFSNYEASLHQVAPISTVEDFWGVYNNLLLPSELDKNTNYHMFKQGIKPTWEHKANKHGGKWVLSFRNMCDAGNKLDKAWLEVLLALIGEHIQKSFLITGAVVSRRKKGDRIAIWTRDKKDITENLEICKHLLHILSLAFNVPDSHYPQFVKDLAEEKDGLTLVYMHHDDSLKTGTSYQNEARLTLRHNLQFLMTKS